MERIDYTAAMSTASWRTITTKKKDGTLVSKQQVTIFFKNEKGERKRKSKLFPVDRDLSTTVRRRNALRAFVSELEAKQEKEIAQAEERAHIEARQKEEALRMESTPTVTACIRAYIDKAKLGLAGTTDHGIEGATILDYEGTARRLEPHFRDVLITDLKPMAISEWAGR